MIFLPRGSYLPVAASHHKAHSVILHVISVRTSLHVLLKHSLHEDANGILVPGDVFFNYETIIEYVW